MDNRNLREEQIETLDQSIALIDEALEHIDSASHRDVVIKLHDALNKINRVVTGDRLDLGGRL